MHTEDVEQKFYKKKHKEKAFKLPTIHFNSATSRQCNTVSACNLDLQRLKSYMLHCTTTSCTVTLICKYAELHAVTQCLTHHSEQIIVMDS